MSSNKNQVPLVDTNISSDGFVLANEEKRQRAIFGSVGNAGEMVGGVGEGAGEAMILAEYDRLGGLILSKENYKVKTGSFYDFKARKARTKPEVVFLFVVNGRPVELTEGEALPIEALAAQKQEKEDAISRKKGKGKGKKKDEDEDEADGE